MADVLVDTDVLVDHLRGASPLKRGRHDLHVSVITRCELFAGQNSQEKEVAALLAALPEHEVDRETAERAGRLRRETGIRTPDALIAATAICHGLVLMTRNSKDFARVSGLKLMSPGS